MSFEVTSVVLATAVADAGTVTVAYPSGTAQADFTGANASATGVAIIDDNDVWTEAAADISLTYGAGDITLTNNSGVTWAAGSTVRVQLGQAGNDRPGFEAGPAIASLTDNSGGTASDTLADIDAAYTEATIANTTASLAAKVNGILAALRSAGIISS